MLLAILILLPTAGCRKQSEPCATRVALLALETAELARLEGDVRAKGYELDRTDGECDIYCAEQERLREEMMSEVREKRSNLKGCIPHGPQE